MPQLFADQVSPAWKETVAVPHFCQTGHWLWSTAIKVMSETQAGSRAGINPNPNQGTIATSKEVTVSVAKNGSPRNVWSTHNVL